MRVHGSTGILASGRYLNYSSFPLSVLFFGLLSCFFPFSFSTPVPLDHGSLPLSLFGDHTRVKLDDARLWMGLTVVDQTPRDGDNLA